MQRLGEMGFRAGRVLLEGLEQVIEMQQAVLCLQHHVHLGGVQGEPDRVAGLDHHVPERGGEATGVAVLGLAAVAGEIHRGAAVEHEIDAEIGLVLEPFDVILVGPGQHPPIDMFRVVADAVRLVIGELRARSVERAAVGAGQVALDHRPRPEREPAERVHLLRREERGDPLGFVAGSGV